LPTGSKFLRIPGTYMTVETPLFLSNATWP
jgi:hypothetical protein